MLVCLSTSLLDVSITFVCVDTFSVQSLENARVRQLGRGATINTRAAHRGATGAFCPGPQPERGPLKGPLNTCLKDRYTLIEQSDLNTLIEQSQYSSEEQCSKLIDKEICRVQYLELN